MIGRHKLGHAHLAHAVGHSIREVLFKHEPRVRQLRGFDPIEHNFELSRFGNHGLVAARARMDGFGARRAALKQACSRVSCILGREDGEPKQDCILHTATARMRPPRGSASVRADERVGDGFGCHKAMRHDASELVVLASDPEIGRLMGEQCIARTKYTRPA